LNTSLRTGESAPAHAVSMFIVPMTLFSCASCAEAVIALTIRRVSTTVSSSAARTIRPISECWFDTFTNSVRFSSCIGSLESTPTIASISGCDSSAWASRLPQ
jgi:hypothetical protein